MILATFSQRIAAAIFDFITIVLLSGIISYFLLTINVSMQDIISFNVDFNHIINIAKFNQYLLSKDFWYSKIPLFISTFIFGMTICLFWIFNNGSTLGQYIFNVKVVSKNNEKMSVLQSFIRAFVYTLFYNIPIMHIISSLMILIRKDKLSAHDLIVGTKVVKRKD